MEGAETEAPRLRPSVGRLLGVGAAIGLNRADRLRLFYQERKAEIVKLSALAALTTFAGFMSAVLGVAFMASLFDQPARTIFLVALCVVLLAAAILCVLPLVAKLRAGATPFSTTVAELRADLGTLLPRHDPPNPSNQPDSTDAPPQSARSDFAPDAPDAPDAADAADAAGAPDA